MRVARGAAPTEHRVLLLWLIRGSTHECRILVSLKVREAHNHLVGPKGSAYLAYPLCQLFYIKGDFVLVATRELINLFFEGTILDVPIINKRERMHADV